MLLATRAPKREALKFINMWSNTEAHAHTHGHTHTCTGGQTLHYSVSTNAPNSACTEEGGAQIHYSVATHRSTHTHTCTGGQTLHYSVSTNAPSNACTEEGGTEGRDGSQQFLHVALQSPENHPGYVSLAFAESNGKMFPANIVLGYATSSEAQASFKLPGFLSRIALLLKHSAGHRQVFV